MDDDDDPLLSCAVAGCSRAFLDEVLFSRLHMTKRCIVFDVECTQRAHETGAQRTRGTKQCDLRFFAVFSFFLLLFCSNL